MWLPISGGRLEANSAGSGPDAVVFLHEIGSEGMCGFGGYAHWLVSHFHKVQVVLVNRCGYGATVCPSTARGTNIVPQTEPAIDWARHHGARRVTLVGASGGGMDALEGAALIPDINAVVDLSGDVNDTGANDNALVRRITIPALLVVAPGDPYCPISGLRGYYAKIPARAKRLLIENKYRHVHGWDLLSGPTGGPSALAATVARWVLGDIPRGTQAR
jgi:pimeloyl-ACP methyl ester carboxylesterase